MRELKEPTNQDDRGDLRVFMIILPSLLLGVFLVVLTLVPSILLAIPYLMAISFVTFGIIEIRQRLRQEE